MQNKHNGPLLLAGDGFSAFGTWIDFLAILTLAAYQFNVSPYEMAIVSAAGLLPGILMSSTIGKLCDRGDPKKLLLLSIVGRVAATAAILFCDAFLPFLALVAFRSVFANVAPPAINVLAVRSVETTHLTKFYSILNILNNSAKVLAPAIGTISSSLSSETVALVMSLIFSSASFIAFSFIAVPVNKSCSQEGPQPTEVKRAISVIPLVWIAATYAFFVFMVNNLVPLILQKSGFDKSLLGVLVSCSGAGNILSGLWLAKKSESISMKGEMSELTLPAMLQAFGFGAIGVLIWRYHDKGVILLPLIFFVIGTFSARYAIALNVHISKHYIDSVGSVSGTLQAWQNSMLLIAPMIGAVVLDRMGVPALFAFAAGSAVISFSVFFVLRATGIYKLKASVVV